MAKTFASAGDLTEKIETLNVLAEGVYALTAEGDPNIGAIEGEDFIVAIEARATPKAASDWLEKLREHTDKPIRYLVLTHYHAVRVLGASAFGADEIIAHEATRFLLDERGQEDWDSEFGRMPRLFREPDGIPGLTHPTLSFADNMRIELGGDRGHLELKFCGRGHTAGDIAVWYPKHKVLFAGDLVEAEAALYTGDAFHMDWSTDTLDTVKAFEAEMLIGGRGAVAMGRDAVDAAIEQTRSFLIGMRDNVKAVHDRNGTLKEAFEATHAALAPKFGQWPIFEHCLPFNVQRLWDEYDGIDWPRIWTMERDREVWALLQD
ncbi:MAG TPA: MBL fold metallo-hydrolase [Hellea balneolensis]|uniref:MBL fold metallo-hydrolase n=1 Tax=Hellea balneolensis TaxID=287478 RepID=A0A7C3C964_9PROT|nr:MBL fold metallo-hydrolase [Hellea balneolensis]